MKPIVLSIAGSDPCGGAGIQADLKTISAMGCYGLTAITALTVQNTQGVYDIHLPPPDFVAAEIDALFADSTISAVKIGMLGSPAIAEAVADALSRHAPAFCVLDPVRAASSGAALAHDDLAATLIARLAPLTSLVTPNLSEAAWLCAAAVPTQIDEMEDLARRLHGMGFRAILLKGGHLDGPSSDDLFFDGTGRKIFAGERIATRNAHGTGCTLSSAIAAYVAQGCGLLQAIECAKHFVTEALAAADALNVGKGPGPLDHFCKVR